MELKEINEKIATLLAWFSNVPHKELIAYIATRQKLGIELTRLEQTYMTMMQQQATAQQRMQERATLDATYTELTSSLQALHVQQQELHTRLAPTHTSPVHTLPMLEQTKQYIESITVQYMLLDQLIGERNQSQTQVKKLEQQDVMLKQLADIFSKELLYVVLNDFLPQLESIINVFLAQMVEYTVHFYLPQVSDEKMELSIEIHDEKGKRPVKSLSGGQKSILKFAWIMAVTNLFQAKFVFLDETMNSLDADTIAQVAQVLQDALIEKHIPFYCVTHAPQIQALPFWKRKIALSL